MHNEEIKGISETHDTKRVNHEDQLPQARVGMEGKG